MSDMQQRSILWPVRASLWRAATFIISLAAAPYSLAYEASEFRKPYLKSALSSKTAYSCKAEFTASFCTLMSNNKSEPMLMRRATASV